MTANYTHTRGETLREQVEGGLGRWPAPLEFALQRVSEVISHAEMPR